MDIVKKNVVSILCGVVAIIAIVLVFFPIGGLYETLQAKVSARAAEEPTLNKLLTENRTIPTLAPGTTEAPTLSVFPTAAVTNYGESIVGRWKTQTLEYYNKAVALNTLTPLVPESLSNVPRTARAYAVPFRTAYRTAYGLDLKPEDGIEKDQSIRVTLLQGGLPPTAAEISARQKAEATAINAQNLRFERGSNKAINADAVAALVKERLASLPQQMREAAALQYKIYVGRDAFEPSSSINLDAPPTQVNIFNAQIALWVHQEFAKAIAETNKGAKNITDAPIKRLVKITNLQSPYGVSEAVRSGGGGFNNGGFNNPALPSTPGGEGAAPAAALTVSETGTLTRNYSTAPTGHTSNTLFDPVTFEATLVVDLEHLPQVLNDLTAKRFITIRNVELTTLNSKVEQAKGFIYGPDPVAEIRINCEMLFFRKWLAPLMPSEVVARLNGAYATPAAGM